MMLRAIRWRSGPRDAQSKGRFGTLLARHSCLLCGVTEGEILTISLLAINRQITNLISSWINMVTMKDTSILTSAPTTAIFVLNDHLD